MMKAMKAMMAMMRMVLITQALCAHIVNSVRYVQKLNLRTLVSNHSQKTTLYETDVSDK